MAGWGWRRPGWHWRSLPRNQQNRKGSGLLSRLPLASENPAVLLPHAQAKGCLKAVAIGNLNRPGVLRPLFEACVLGFWTEHCAAYMEPEAAPLPLSDKLWTWFETNKKQALYGAVVLVAGGIIAGYIYWLQNEKELAADEALSNVSA